MTPPLSPVGAFLDAVGQPGMQVGGNLSAARGFLPLRLHTEPLAGEHAVWEQLAAELPALAFEPDLQRRIAAMPTVPSGPDRLADGQLTWAATLLGILAHAYWRMGADRFLPARRAAGDGLPDCIAVPWEQVCRRLGRARVGLSFEDLTLNNFVPTRADAVGGHGGYDLAEVRTEWLRLLVPAYGSRTERVFFTVFAEIHAALVPLVAGLPALESAVRAWPDAHDDLIAALAAACGAVDRATAALRKVSPTVGSPTHCDPVEWGKTVAPFTVPPPGRPIGPSGSAAPVVHLLDALVGRTAYESTSGRITRTLHAEQLPRNQRVLCDLLRAMDLKGTLRARAASAPTRAREAVEAFNTLVDRFAGGTGFLGVHKAKVVDYLTVGMLVGRDQSTAHQDFQPLDRSWTSVARDLHRAMDERVRVDLGG